MIIFPGRCGFPSLMVWSASFILTLLQSNAYLQIVNGQIKEHNPEKLLPCSNTAGQRLKIANSKAKSRRSLSKGNPPPFTILPWGYVTTKLCNCISFILHHWWNSSNLNEMFSYCLITAFSFGIFCSSYVFARVKGQFFWYNH